MPASAPRRLRALLVSPLLILVLLVGSVAAAKPLTSRQLNRDRLLSFILRQQLVMDHYSHKLIDDHLSEAAFGLYLKQLDARKRFLLQSDVDELTAYKDRIDDEIYQGRMKLPVVSAQIMARRIPVVRKMVSGLLTQKFDFDRHESLQTDPAKLAYCKDSAELRERWRKVLKFQVINRYLDLKEDQAAGDKKAKKASDEELRQQARKKVQASLNDLFDRMSEETEQDYFDRYFDAIARAFDPHTDYFPPEQKEDFDISMRGSLEGIGATLREEDGYVKVVGIIPGGPAARQGQLQPEDTILKVAQGKGEPVEITGISLRDAVNLIRGKKGTLVKLTVRRPDGRRLVIPIVRDVVQIEETFVKSTTVTDPKNKKAFGYVMIPSFYRDFKHIQEGKGGRNVTDDVRRALEKLKAKKISGLIIDLRNDGGGALTDAVSVAGLFIKTGPVVQVRSSDGSIRVLSDKDPSIEYGGPLIVL
ncbi:MAG TPA: S41 family peptidase, partial [Desulfuromonadales bacterium]|nr:S41 family peptidase [Desulfuromonadales bacterium]